MKPETLRLAVFTSQFPSRVSTFFARDLRGLISAGVEVDVFPLHPVDATLWRYVPDLLNEDMLPRDRVHDVPVTSAAGRPLAAGWDGAWRFARGAASVAFSSAKGGPAAMAKSGYALAKAWMWSQMQGGRFDHVLAYWGNYAATAAIAFHRLTAPRLPMSMFLHAGTDLYRPVGMRAKLLYVDNVIVVCDFNRRYIEERYPDISPLIREKIHVHHPGLDVPAIPFSGGGRPGARLLAVGSFEKAKGFADLLAATGLLRARGVDVDVDLVGDGPEGGSLRRLVSTLHLADSVRFRGWLPSEQVQQAMLEATLLVHPSIGLGDAVPTVIKEAMAVGTPVVASAVAGIPELVDNGRCGTLVPPRDPSGLADAIASLLSNPQRRADQARAGRAFAEENFDLWSNGRRLAGILRATRRARAGEAA